MSVSFSPSNLTQPAESRAELAKALVAAQKKMQAAHKTAKNPYFKAKYADLNSVISACKEALNDEGICVLQPVYSDSTGDYVETVLLHTSGQSWSSRTKLKVTKENDMQAYGSAISYARRYGLQSMVFLPSTEDDDGELAVGREASKVEAAPKPAAIVAKPAEKAPAPAKAEEPAKPATFFKPSAKTPEWK